VEREIAPLDAPEPLSTDKPPPVPFSAFPADIEMDPAPVKLEAVEIDTLPDAAAAEEPVANNTLPPVEPGDCPDLIEIEPEATLSGVFTAASPLNTPEPLKAVTEPPMSEMLSPPLTTTAAPFWLADPALTTNGEPTFPTDFPT